MSFQILIGGGGGGGLTGKYRNSLYSSQFSIFACKISVYFHPILKFGRRPTKTITMRVILIYDGLPEKQIIRFKKKGDATINTTPVTEEKPSSVSFHST